MSKLPEEPAISIPFSEFIEYALGSSDKAKVLRPYHALLLLNADPEERYIHVELPDKSNSLEVPVVWRIKEWKDSSKRLMKLREISEIESQWRFKRDDMLEELAAAIHVHLGGEKEWCKQKADFIYYTKNINAAKIFGCNSMEDVIETKPESLKGKVEIRL